MKLPSALTSLSFAALLLASATPASAAHIACPATTDPQYVACASFDGNLNNASSIDDLNAAVDQLLQGTGLTIDDLDWDLLDPTKDWVSGDGNDPDGTITFINELFGNQIISAHFGGAGGAGGDATLLYLFNFGTDGAITANLGLQGFSNAVVITPPGAIPEPGTWAMMLLGFGAIGFAMRRRIVKRQLPQVA